MGIHEIQYTNSWKTVPKQLVSMIIINTIKYIHLFFCCDNTQAELFDSVSRVSDFCTGTANPVENYYLLEMETGRHKQEGAIWFLSMDDSLLAWSK